MFLIGANFQFFKNAIMKTLYLNEHTGYNYNEKGGFLFPYQTKEFSFNKRKLILTGIENVELDSMNKIKREYDIEYVFLDKGYRLTSGSLRGHLDLCCTARKHSLYQTPQIIWVGELNDDGVLDAIMVEHTMTGGCGGCSSYSLFLSNVQDNNITLNYIDSAISCN